MTLATRITGADPFLVELAQILATLVELGQCPLSGVYLREGATEAAIGTLQTEVQRELGQPLPEEYAALLRLTNGLQINNVLFKKAEELVPENLELFRPGILILGREGNTAELVFDGRDRRFHIVNLGSPDERFSSFDSLAGLLAEVLREQQVL